MKEQSQKGKIVNADINNLISLPVFRFAVVLACAAMMSLSAVVKQNQKNRVKAKKNGDFSNVCV